MADVKLNTLPQSTSPTSTQDLLLFDESTNAGQRINYNTLADVILAKLTSKTYTVGGGTQTLISAIDALNSKTPANPTVLTASDDMNNITTPGVYAQWNDNMPLHAPTTQYNATILVYNMRPYEVWQIWASANTKDVWTRMKAGGNWTDWQKQPTRAEVDALSSNKWKHIEMVDHATLTLSFRNNYVSVFIYGTGSGLTPFMATITASPNGSAIMQYPSNLGITVSGGINSVVVKFPSNWYNTWFSAEYEFTYSIT